MRLTRSARSILFLKRQNNTITKKIILFYPNTTRLIAHYATLIFSPCLRGSTRRGRGYLNSQFSISPCFSTYHGQNLPSPHLPIPTRTTHPLATTKNKCQTHLYQRFGILHVGYCTHHRNGYDRTFSHRRTYRHSHPSSTFNWLTHSLFIPILHRQSHWQSL